MSFAILGLGFLTGVPTYGKEDESLDAHVTVPNDTEISLSPLYHSNIGKVTSIKILNRISQNRSIFYREWYHGGYRLRN